MARILVVDDDPDILRVVEKILLMGGHTVFTAYDGMQALDLLKSSLYDILITDAKMPKVSGFELTRTVKSNKRFQRMAICMLTGLSEKKDIEKAIRAGIDDYIVKPIDPSLLVQKIESILKKKPPMERAEYTLPEGLHYTEAKVTTTVRIAQLSELGLVLRTPVEMLEGMTIQIASDLFKKMEIKALPPMKVISCRKLVEFDYEINVAFVGPNEGMQQRIRSWIYSQNTASQPKKKGAA